MASNVDIDLDLTVYSQDSISKAAHAFTGQAYVQMDTLKPNQLRVKLTPKSDSITVQTLHGEFLNCLLDFSLRDKLEEKTEGIRHLILAHALSKTDLLHPELEDDKSTRQSAP